MFDRLFTQFYKGSDRIRIGSLDLYINYLRQIKSRMLSHYGVTMGKLTLGISALAQVIGDAEVDLLIKDYPDPVDRYLRGIIPIAHRVSSLIDPSYRGPIKAGSFITSPTRCMEFIFPITPRVPFGTYPMTQNWDDWKGFSPLHLIDIDTEELSFLNYLDTIAFKKSNPSYAAFTLDVRGLLMMYIAYVRSVPVTEQSTIGEWLHRYVVYPCLINDMLTHWLLTQYSALAENTYMSDDGVIDKWSTATNVSIGSSHKAALDDTAYFLRQMREGTLTVNKLMNSLELIDYGSLYEYHDFLKNELDFSLSPQLQWGEFMRDYRLMRLTLQACLLYTKTSEIESFAQQFSRAFKLYVGTAPWNQIKQHTVRDTIVGQVSDIERLIELLLSNYREL